MDGELLWSTSDGDIGVGPFTTDGAVVVASGTTEGGFTLLASEADNGKRRWKAELGSGDFPAQMFTLGKVVVIFTDGSSGQAFEAFDVATGEGLWLRSLSDGTSLGAVESNGKLLFADSAEDRVVALDLLTGAEQWVQGIPGVSGKIPVVSETQVLVSSLTEVHALEASSGKEAWVARAVGEIEDLVAIGDAVGAVTFGQGSPPAMVLEMFSGESGEQLWAFRSTNISLSPPPLATPGGVLLLTAPDPLTGDTVIVLNSRTGDLVWSAKPSREDLGPAVVLTSGEVVVPSTDESGDSALALYGSSGGDVIWVSPIPGTVLLPPVQFEDSLIVASQTDNGKAGTVVGIDVSTGTELWSRDTAMPVSSKPLVTDDSIVIACARRLDLGP